MLTTVNNILFSEWLIEEMAKRGMSQADLARKTKLTTGGISNLVNQVRNPSPEALIAIAKAFDFPPEDVFRKAGILPEKHEIDQLSQEAEFLLAQMPEAKRQQAINFIRFLARDTGDDIVTHRVEKP